MRQWFVTPEEVKLPLFDDGQCWITVRKQLTAGEEKKLSTGALKKMSPSIQSPQVSRLLSQHQRQTLRGRLTPRAASPTSHL